MKRHPKTRSEILQCGCLTKGSEGEVLAPLSSLKEAGVGGFRIAPSSPQNTEIFARGLEYASMFDLPVIEFPRDLTISSRGVAADGEIALKMGIGGYPRMAEELFVQRAIIMQKFGDRGASHFDFVGELRRTDTGSQREGNSYYRRFRFIWL